MAYTTIKKPSDYFNTKLYTGNGSTNALTGVGFQPDFTWIKSRSNAENHNLFDAVRGATKRIRSNGAEAEDTRTTSLTAFDSDGFTLGSGSQVNTSGWTFASWNWKANGQGSSNTDGSINTTYTSANTTAGFSIIKYAGTGSSGTIGHGLSATPKVLLIKEIDGAEGWRVWHRNAPNYSTKALQLNSTSAEFSQTNWIGTVDNSIITLGTDSSINTSGNNYICYAFAPKTGYSKFGSYTGNGNADGTFIYTGFSPAFVMMKNASQAGKWLMMDNKRPTSGGNPNNARLFADVSNAESTTSNMIDMLSNGFKVRTSDTDHNASGDTNIYMAFAQEPLVGDNPATAR